MNPFTIKAFLFILIAICELCSIVISQQSSDRRRTGAASLKVKNYTATEQQERIGATKLNTRGNSDICNCTSLFQCDISSAESEEDGADVEVIDIRNQFGTNPCKHYLEICCNLFQQDKPVPERPRTPLPRHQQCGKRNINGVGFRIVGNIEDESQMGEFPWMVAITEIDTERQRAEYVCGGSLIHPRIVLTGAHCVHKKSVEKLSVRAGEWDTQTEREDPYIHHDREVDQIIIHEGFQIKRVLKNDIALLVLSKEVPLARHIGTICLMDIKPTRGQRCFASGWGKNLYGRDGSYQSILKKVDLPIVPPEECEMNLRGTRLGPNFRLHESFVCAGGEKGKDTCKGDGGSPLVCQIPGSDRYAQYGIVSWGLNCGDPIPGAYVNVPLFVPWIEEQLKRLGFETRYFIP